MSKRKKFKLANIDKRDVDLTQYADLIIDAVNRTVPNKHPEVFPDCFVVDLLTQRESVLLGKELSSIPELNKLGKTVSIFRLFNGRVYDCKDSEAPAKEIRGGRVR